MIGKRRSATLTRGIQKEEKQGQVLYFSVLFVQVRNSAWCGQLRNKADRQDAMADIQLTAEDVQNLLREPSPEIRVDLASKVARQFDAVDLSESEREIAEEIFRIMVQDAEVRVREALALNLKDNSMVPRDVALSLARDVDSVSLPLLQFSEVLTAEDLVEIVRSQKSQDVLKAVAKRRVVEANVADELVNRGDADVAATLAGNAGAELTEKSMLKIVERFGDHEVVHGPLATRAYLPVTVTERLVNRVSEALKEHILHRHELPPDLAADLVMQTRERAVISLSSESSEDDVERLVRQMSDHKRLTPSIVVRAICMGDLVFFEYAMAARSRLPVVNVRRLIHDSGALGLKGIFQKCRMPENMYPAVRAAIDVIAETDFDGEDGDIERHQRRVLERILTQYGDLGVDLEKSDLEYLLAKVEKLPHPTGGIS